MAESDDFSGRLDELKLLWESDPTAKVYLQLAEEYRRLGQVHEAIRVLEKTLTQRPRDPRGRVLLARCRMDIGEVGEATRILEEVARMDPTHAVASKMLLECYLQLEDRERASERFNLYRLLNDRDPELDHLEFRLKRLVSGEGVEESRPIARPAEKEEAVSGPSGKTPDLPWVLQPDPLAQVAPTPAPASPRPAPPAAAPLDLLALGLDAGVKSKSAADPFDLSGPLPAPTPAAAPAAPPAPTAAPSPFDWLQPPPKIEAAPPAMTAAPPAMVAAQPFAPAPAPLLAPTPPLPSVTLASASDPFGDLPFGQLMAPPAAPPSFDLFAMLEPAAPSSPAPSFEDFWQIAPAAAPSPSPGLSSAASVAPEPAVWASQPVPAEPVFSVPTVSTWTAEPEAAPSVAPDVAPLPAAPEIRSWEAVAVPETLFPEERPPEEIAAGWPELEVVSPGVEPAPAVIPEAVAPAPQGPAAGWSEPEIVPPAVEPPTWAPAAPTLYEPTPFQPAMPALFEPTPEPALFEPTPEPALFEPTPEPALFEPTPEPALFEPTPESALFEPTPEPALFEASPSPWAETPAIAPESTSFSTAEAQAEEPEDLEATATLGDLYLLQGHVAEAEGIYLRVLRRDPANATAQAGLQRLKALQSDFFTPAPPVAPAAPVAPPLPVAPVAAAPIFAPATLTPDPVAPPVSAPAQTALAPSVAAQSVAVRGPLTAADLLGQRSAPHEIPAGLTAKKILVLRRYLQHLRSARPAYVQ